MTAARALALLRVGLGLEFAIWAWIKTLDGWLTSGSALEVLLTRYLPQAEPDYAHLLEMYVLPNVDIFSRLVTIGEWTAALTLTFGFFTRFGSLVGMWLTANFMLMRGLLDVSGSIDHVSFLGCLVCLIAAAGNVWGLDALLLDPEPKPGRVKPRPVANTWANPRVAFSTMRPSLGTARYAAAYAPHYTTTYAPQ
jgi:uncharacterized membrane protein YphA (DoxX/SURF4 family)